jgi:outer membrane autotransporter protein
MANFRISFFLWIIFVLNLFIADAIFGDEFSLRLFDCSEYYSDSNLIMEQSTFYRCSDKSNIVTIIPQQESGINSRLVGGATMLSSNNRNIGNRLFGVYDSDDKSLRTWISNFGNWSELDNGGNNSDSVLTFYSWGFAAGIDRLIERKFLVGITFGWDRTVINSPQSRNINFSAGHGHVYFRTIFQRLYVDVEGGIGLGNNALLVRNAAAQDSALQWNFQVESGMWSYEGLMKIEPFVSLQHAALKYNSQYRTRSATIAGVRCSWQSAGLFAVSTPRFYGGIIREFGNSNIAATSLFADSPTIFVAQNQKITKTRFFGGCGTTASMGSTLEIYFRYTAEAAANYASHTVIVGMNWIF